MDEVEVATAAKGGIEVTFSKAKTQELLQNTHNNNITHNNET